MNTDRTLGRLGAGIAASVAVAAGASAALADPAFGATPAGTVVAHTLPGPSTSGVATIVPSPASAAADWIVRRASGSDTSVDVLGADGAVTTASLNGPAISTGGTVGPVAAAGDSASFVFGGSTLLGLTPGSPGSVNSAAIGSASGVDARAATIGPDGRVYVTDNAGTIRACPASGTGSTCARYPIMAEADAIASAGGSLWFTNDDNDGLTSMTTAGTVSSVVDTNTFSPAAAGLVALGGKLWLISRDQHSIDEVSPSSPTTVTPHAIAGAATPTISSLTAGPDGNLWFTDTANQAVGYVAAATGASTEYPVAAGTSIAGNIVPGPAATNTLVVPLVNGAAKNIVGQIQSPVVVVTPPSPPSPPSPPAPTPAPVTPPVAPVAPAPAPTVTPTLGLARTAAVSSKRVASLRLHCSSPSEACSGRLTLTVTVKRHGRGHRHARTVTLARARYRVMAGASQSLKIQLSAAGYRLLRAAHGHRLRVTVASVATSGHGPGGKVTLVTKRSK